MQSTCFFLLWEFYIETSFKIFINQLYTWRIISYVCLTHKPKFNNRKFFPSIKPADSFHKVLVPSLTVSYWLPTPIILAWQIPWTEEPLGYSLWCHKESDTTERLTHRHMIKERGYFINVNLNILSFETDLFLCEVIKVRNLCASVMPWATKMGLLF